ncbi:MAG: T9SS type A sorting domain-containing protein [Ignavibacteriales bacterium]|nr:MAG: T9SS type A sorting domain-containing protein [Ignavibacteriales bacterium]
MNKKIIGLLMTFIVIVSLLSLGFKGEDKNKQLQKAGTNDNYEYIAINQVLMWVSNNGDGSHDPRTDGNGFYWPGGINAQKSAIFEDGLIFGAKVGREIRVNGNTHRQGLQAGKILSSGTPDDPSLDRYRVFKIRKGWELLPPGPEKDEYERDYNEWPIEDGAPWVDIDGDGLFTRGVDQPEFVGDEVLWYVSNDMDPARSTFTYGTLPMGLEFQTTIFGFNRTGALGDMVFKKYKVINKGGNTLKDVIFAYWSDTDLGDAADDFTGCDTALSLGYTYNSDNDDGGGAGATYGSSPPAIGYDFFQGPIVEGNPNDSAKFDGKWIHGFRNLPMTAFAFYINGDNVYRDPQQGVPTGSIEFYYYLQGYVWDGTEFTDPHTGLPTRLCLTGDPVGRTGWYEGDGWPGGKPAGDRRHLMASGPFEMAPGDTQEIVVGLVIARGSSNINSITALKTKDVAAQIAYDLDFNLTPSPQPPATHSISSTRALTLWWETNSESYDEGDPLIYNQGFSDTTYTFQGYRVWQYRDLAGTDPVLLDVSDIDDGVNQFMGVMTVNGVDVIVPLITGPDNGVKRFINITQDAYTNGALFDGNPYYFAITAFGYSENSSPTFLESTPVIVEVFPGRPAIDVSYPYLSGDEIVLNKVGGSGDGRVKLQIIDPSALTGHEYEVPMISTSGGLRYSLVDKTSGDTLIKESNDFSAEATYKEIRDGFVVIVENIGRDSLGSASSKIRSIREVKGPGGIDLSDGPFVFDRSNSTNQWQIKARKFADNTPGTIDDINYLSNIGDDDYEIRFTAGGSEYYTTGYTPISPTLRDNPKGKNRVPFEIWNIGRDPGDVPERLIIKTLDNGVVAPRDTSWNQDPATNTWESIFAYTPTTPYSEPLPNMSGASVSGNHRIGNLSIVGSLPAEGTVIRIRTWRQLGSGDVFTGIVKAPEVGTQIAKTNIEDISVFPNPYFGANNLERDKYQRFMRFTNLPSNVTIRIFSLSGVFIQTLTKNSTNQYLDWNLRNRDGLPIASGIYLAYLDMPGVGTKVMKLAVIMETQYIDRL